MKRELLVLTDRERSKKRWGELTYRLIIPPLIACDLPSSTNYDLRIWWAERYAGRTYLKACLDDCKVQTRYTKQGEKQFVALGKMDTSSYIYRDEPTCPIKWTANPGVRSGLWEIVELDDHQASLLINSMMEVSPTVLNMENATRLNRRVLSARWPNIDAHPIYPKRIWRVFKRYAALNELVRVNGLDPYETSVVAALMDVGAAFSIRGILRAMYDTKKVIRPNSNSRSNTSIMPPAFIPLISKLRHYACRRTPRSTTSILLRDMAIEHERIVASLAYKLESMGLTPYVSPLVDVAVINDRSAVFFEVKTVNNENLLDQIRGAIGQLLEYRFAYKNPFERIHLCIVTAAPLYSSKLSFVKNFVKDCGITWVSLLPHDTEFSSLDRILAKFDDSSVCNHNQSKEDKHGSQRMSHKIPVEM